MRGVVDAYSADGDDPFAGAAPQSPAAPPPPPPPAGEVNTLATLSVIFAFVFAPVGAVLGHLALSQMKHRTAPGWRRAVLGLALSYAFIALAVIALIVWLIVGAGKHGAPAPATAAAPAPAPSVSSTVITPPARERARVSVAELRPGDCVEIQKNEPDPTRPNTDKVYLYRARCEVRDGVFQVQQKAASASQCPPAEGEREYLTNEQENIVACFVKFGG